MAEDEEKSLFETGGSEDDLLEEAYIKWLKGVLGKLISEGWMTLPQYTETLEIIQKDIADGVSLESLQGYDVFATGNRDITNRYVKEQITAIEKNQRENTWLKHRQKEFGGVTPSEEAFKAIQKAAQGQGTYEMWKAHAVQMAKEQVGLGAQRRSTINPEGRSPGFSNWIKNTQEPEFPQVQRSHLDPFLSQLTPSQQQFWGNRTGEILQPVQKARQSWWDEILRNRSARRQGEALADKTGIDEGIGREPDPIAADPLADYLKNFDFKTKFYDTPRYQRGFFPSTFAPPARFG